MNRILIALVAFAISTSGVKADEPIRLPSGQLIERVDFERHVAPLLSRLGCNAGSCHGASNGKGDFRLSLFGYDSKADYEAITSAGSGRVDVDEAASSLILEKPTLAVDHGGGLRLPRDSWEYQLVARWINDGAQHVPESGKLLQVEIEPRENVLTISSPRAEVRVMATFANGDRVDVTSLSRLRVQDETVASVDDRGTLRRVGSGDTAVIATYSGWPANAYILVPRDGEAAGVANTAYPKSLIDRHVSAKLRRLHIEPTTLSSDETFLRRVTLATIGQLPSPDTIREFIADKSSDKRDRKINELLSDSLHAATWATRMCEITGSGNFGESQMPPAAGREEKWHAWFRIRFADNVPYDRIARGMLCGTTRGRRDAIEFVQSNIQRAARDSKESTSEYAERKSLDLFWQRPKVNEEIDVEGIAARIAAAFLGVRMECARCHKHPFDRWTRNDYRSFANLFTQVRFGMSPSLRSSLVDALEEQRTRAREGAPKKRIPSMREVFVSSTPRDFRDAATQQRLPVKPIGGAVMETGGDRRDAFVDWLTSRDNPYFARNFVNRVWAKYFGVGLVGPVDAFSAGNPPSHPALLDALARDFVDHGFNIRRLERQILQSRAWQRAATTNDTCRTDRRNFARAYVRVLPADVLLDAISCAIGDQQPRAVEIAGRRAGDKQMDMYFEIFNRPERKLTCDCEQSDEPTLRQSMLLLADPALMERIQNGHVARLAASDVSDEKVIEELFLLTLSRSPDREELNAARKHVASAPNRKAALGDVVWSLMNTREFVTNH